ncbi:hypothetical protein NQZ79_g6394 [Umbelopsis isabellina]|nr:hypothetical protein NQZ79_g6394 [Umbelopsis isabellina]
MVKKFNIELIPDMTGKVCIITGSNTGIGKACAMELAQQGAHVIVASRTPARGIAAVKEIQEATGNAKVEFLQLDLASIESVSQFITEFKAKNLPIHLLMNNAGVMACPYELSKDGIEMQFATNHVGHFYLTTQLLPIIEASAPSRIVNVSSNGHRFIQCRGLRLDDLNDKDKYAPFTAYGRSKAANILFTRELNRRLEAKGVQNVYVNANHPGVVDSELARYSPLIIQKFLKTFVLISTRDGSLTQLYLATSPEVEKDNIKGKYYIPYGVEKQPERESASESNQTLLWDFTENLLKNIIPDYSGAGI